MSGRPDVLRGGGGPVEDGRDRARLAGLHVREGAGVVLRRPLAFAPERERFVQQTVGVDVGTVVLEDAQAPRVHGRVRKGEGKLVRDGAGVRRGRAIVALEEALQERFCRKVGVPHPLGDEPALEPKEVGVHARALLEQPSHAVIAEELHVLLHRVEVGEGVERPAEVGDVVPEVEVVGEGAPRHEVVNERRIRRRPGSGERKRVVALDVA